MHVCSAFRARSCNDGRKRAFVSAPGANTLPATTWERHTFQRLRTPPECRDAGIAAWCVICSSRRLPGPALAHMLWPGISKHTTSVPKQGCEAQRPERSSSSRV